MTPTIAPTKKQHQAWEILRDSTTQYFLFGGGAGGGKSWLGCEWLLVNCYMYPGTRWFIGREELKRIKDSTLQTFYKVCSFHKIPSEDYKFNGQDNYIGVANGSRIDLLDLKLLPSDPLYERYGSIEYTGGWLEEAGEVNFNAFDTLKSRIGRHLNDRYSLTGKLLITCNPKKNWLYSVFYKPWKDGTLLGNYKFLQALIDDNPKNESGYRQQLLDITDKAKKERLLYGNWEYDDDPSALIEYDAITDLFTNAVPESRDRYLTGDVARYGHDKTVFTLWQGVKVYKTVAYEKQGIDVTAEKLKTLLRDELIPYSHCIVDEDGVGGGVVDLVRGIKGFMAASSPFPADPKADRPDNYENLKAQCSYRLAELVNNHKLAIRTEDVTYKQHLTEELEQIKSRDSDSDGKRKIVPKEIVKQLLGRSPDYADCLMMRMYFELNRQIPFVPQQTTGVKRYYPEIGI